MPELPEVETVRRGLKPLIAGRTIEQVNVLWDNIIDGDTTLFAQQLQGARFLDIKRRGKYLIFVLDRFELVSHLRMEGKYQVVATDTPITKHTHVIFTLDNGEDLRYLDVRKFGRMAVLEKGTAEKYAGIKKLGPEPTAETFLAQDFAQKLAKKNKPIKNVLLDQTVVAGIGNIYADEILFLSKIHPLTWASSLNPKEINLLHDTIIAVLAEAIKDGGTTIRTFENAIGKEGHHQAALLVYGKKGEPCPVCKTTIEKIVVGGRGTYYCPHCQVEVVHD